MEYHTGLKHRLHGNRGCLGSRRTRFGPVWVAWNVPVIAPIDEDRVDSKLRADYRGTGGGDAGENATDLTNA